MFGYCDKLLFATLMPYTNCVAISNHHYTYNLYESDDQALEVEAEAATTPPRPHFLLFCQNSQLFCFNP